MTQTRIAVIGGSGIYDIDGLEEAKWTAVETPWGAPSDELLTGSLDGVPMVFLPRHGRGHPISPGDLNARANIDVLKRAGCTDILAISAVGSLREEIEPGRFAIVEQFIDRTNRQPNSFFGTGLVAHVSMADPLDLNMIKELQFITGFNIQPSISTPGHRQIKPIW